MLPPILPAQALAVPLHLTSWRLQARPKGLGLFFCKVPIHWTNVERPGELSSSKRECQSADMDSSFRYQTLDPHSLGVCPLILLHCRVSAGFVW